MNGTARRIEHYILLTVLVLLLLGGLMIVRPFMSALMWAVVLCFALWPVQRRLVAWLKGNRTLASLVTSLGITLVLVVPVLVIGMNLAGDARDLTTAFRRYLESGPPAPPVWLERLPLLGPTARAYWVELAHDARAMLRQADEDAGRDAAQAGEFPTPPPSVTTQPAQPTRLRRMMTGFAGWAREWLIAAGLAIGQGILEVTLSVFLTFFIFRDGEALAARLDAASARLAGPNGRRLLQVAGNTIRGVVWGILGTAIVQGVMAGVGFAIAGVPGAALLGFATFVLSPIPLGPVVVWFPAALFLFQQGHAGWGVFMLLWGLGVSSIDNVVKPWIISAGSNMPFILIFLGVLGGAMAFGLIGVFLGPTILAIVYKLIDEWSAAPPLQPELPTAQRA